MIKKLPTGDSKLAEFVPFKGIDYIVTDLDGTLILGDAPVQKQIVSCVLSIQKKNTLFSIATGRTVMGAKELVEKLGVKRNVPIAYYNGSVVIENISNRLLYINKLDQPIIKKIFELSRKYDCSIFFYSLNYNENKFTSEVTIDEMVFGTGPKTISTDVNNMKVKWIDDFSCLHGNIITSLIDCASLNKTTKELIYSELNSVSLLSYTSSGSGYIEIKRVDADKGKIFDFLLCRDDITKKVKTISIGDNDNDIELFNKSNISIVVSNASEKSKNFAQYICAHECGKGFLDLLYVIMAANRYLD